MPDASQSRRAGENPGEIRSSSGAQQSLRKWRWVWHDVVSEVLSDHATMTAGALAFYGLLGLIPVLVAMSAGYALFADPVMVQHAVGELRGFLPEAAADALAETLTGSEARLGLGMGLLVSIVIVVWTAQWAASGLISALNIAFEATQLRSFWGRQFAALVIAVGGIVMLGAALLVVALLPLARGIFGVELPQSFLIAIRWPLLALLTMLGLSALYCYGPSRPLHRWKWLNWGAVLATVLWIGISVAFSLYLSHAGSFDQLYGPAGGIVIFVTWLYLSALIILAGAEFEAALEGRGEERHQQGAKHLLRKYERGEV
jgi:membrane protein